MKVQLINFVNNKVVKGLCFSLLPFFVFIAINTIFNYITYVIVAQEFFKIPPIYGKFSPCNANDSKIIPLAGLSIFLFSKMLLIGFFSKNYSSIRSYSWPVLGSFIMTDLVYVVLQFLPSKIDWDFYFHASFLIRPSISFGYPSSIWFGFFGLFFGLFFKNLTKKSWNDLGVYFLLAIVSFFFQLLCTYFLFGKIYYVS